MKTDWLAVFSRAHQFLNLELHPNLFGPSGILARFQGILKKWISVQQSPGKTQGWGSFCNEVRWLGLESFLDPKIGNSIFRSCEISQVGTSTTRSASSSQHILSRWPEVPSEMGASLFWNEKETAWSLPVSTLSLWVLHENLSRICKCVPPILGDFIRPNL